AAGDQRSRRAGEQRSRAVEDERAGLRRHAAARGARKRRRSAARQPAGRHPCGVTMPILLLLAVALTPSARVQREAEDRARGEVALQSVDFPVRNPPHLEAPPPPMPQSAPVPQAAPPAPAPAPATLKERLLQEAPALAAAVLFAIVTMFLGTLFFLAARRSRDPAFETIEA